MGVNRIEGIASAQGLTVEQLLIQVIEKYKSVMKAAQHLDLAPNTLKYNLRKHNLKVITLTKVVKE